MDKLNEKQLKTLSQDLIEFYHQEASKRLEDNVRVESLITERGYILFGMYFAIETATIGYILTHLSTQNDLPVTYGGLAIIVFTTIAIAYIIQVIKPHAFYVPGREPNDLQISQYANYFAQDTSINQKKFVLIDELVVLQGKISSQQELNDKRTELTKKSIYFLIFGSFIAVFSFILTFISI